MYLVFGNLELNTWSQFILWSLIGEPCKLRKSVKPRANYLVTQINGHELKLHKSRYVPNVTKLGPIFTWKNDLNFTIFRDATEQKRSFCTAKFSSKCKEINFSITYLLCEPFVEFLWWVEHGPLSLGSLLTLCHQCSVLVTLKQAGNLSISQQGVHSL